MRTDTIILFLLLSVTAPSLFAAEDCSTARTYISLAGISEDTYYMRVHPNGNYLLFSGKSVTLVDLTDKVHPKAIPTQMNREAYPVEANNTWKWIASPNHESPVSYSDHIMKYFDFKDSLSRGRESKAVYEDPELNQYYHSAAELPGSSASTLHFRTALWYKLQYRDYTVQLDRDGKPTGVEHTKTKSLCSNLENVNFSEPILSKDGTEVAGLTDGNVGYKTTKVYKIKDDNTCEFEYDTGYNTGKVSFSYPIKGEKAMITFVASRVDLTGSQPSQFITNAVYVYDPNSKKSYPISTTEELQNRNYPGFTQDGHIYYVVNGEKGFGITIANAKVLMANRCTATPSASSQNATH